MLEANGSHMSRCPGRPDVQKVNQQVESRKVDNLTVLFLSQHQTRIWHRPKSLRHIRKKTG